MNPGLFPLRRYDGAPCRTSRPGPPDRYMFRWNNGLSSLDVFSIDLGTIQVPQSNILPNQFSLKIRPKELH
jgi:hypothetical protein